MVQSIKKALDLTQRHRAFEFIAKKFIIRGTWQS